MVLSICIVPAAAETTTLPGTGSAKGKTVTLSVTPRTQKIPRSTEDTYVTFDITITPPERQKIAAFSFALAELTGMTLAGGQLVEAEQCRSGEELRASQLFTELYPVFRRGRQYQRRYFRRDTCDVCHHENPSRYSARRLLSACRDRE